MNAIVPITCNPQVYVQDEMIRLVQEEFEEIENNFAALVADSTKRSSHGTMQKASLELLALKREFLSELDQMKWQPTSYQSFQERAQEMSRQLQAIAASAVMMDKHFFDESAAITSRLHLQIQAINEKIPKSPIAEITPPTPMSLKVSSILAGSGIGGIAGYAIEKKLDHAKAIKAFDQAVDSASESRQAQRLYGEAFLQVEEEKASHQAAVLVKEASTKRLSELAVERSALTQTYNDALKRYEMAKQAFNHNMSMANANRLEDTKVAVQQCLEKFEKFNGPWREAKRSAHPIFEAVKRAATELGSAQTVLAAKEVEAISAFSRAVNQHV